MIPRPDPKFAEAIGLVLWTGSVLRHVPSIEEVLEQGSDVDRSEIIHALDWLEQNSYSVEEVDEGETEPVDCDGCPPWARGIEDVQLP